MITGNCIASDGQISHVTLTLEILSLTESFVQFHVMRSSKPHQLVPPLSRDLPEGPEQTPQGLETTIQS